MNYQAFTNDSLALMYEGVRGALASDDTTKAQGGKPDFASARRPTGSSPLRISILKCSSVNVFRSHRLVGRSGAASVRVMKRFELRSARRRLFCWGPADQR